MRPEHLCYHRVTKLMLVTATKNPAANLEFMHGRMINLFLRIGASVISWQIGQKRLTLRYNRTGHNPPSL